ncbi:hypothetical protein HS088_TW06G00243 [Tripterygium wilfordii]|uniref:Uncharacterized protein n=1 Tax=Tripterygium wilfordii TaxID=458696 RepID=A0A7J7DIF1_TRIWF|nr:hypothetical protein HS088_TW06G00243 [Tripterygium wilfordii]
MSLKLLSLRLGFIVVKRFEFSLQFSFTLISDFEQERNIAMLMLSMIPMSIGTKHSHVDADANNDSDVNRSGVDNYIQTSDSDLCSSSDEVRMKHSHVDADANDDSDVDNYIQTSDFDLGSSSDEVRHKLCSIGWKHVPACKRRCHKEIY